MAETDRGVVELLATAGPMVRDRARRLALRWDLDHQDHEDLEQELWLRLLCRWRGAPTPIHGLNGRTGRDREIARCVDHAAASLMRRSAASQTPLWAEERPFSTLRGREIAAHDSALIRRRLNLRLDLASLLPRLPDDQGRLCQTLLLLEAQAGGGSDGAFLDRKHEHQLAALRRVFRAHGLHEYL